MKLTIWWYVDGMTFILCSHVRPKMALKGEKSSTTENRTFRMTGPAWIGNITSPSDVVEAPLNPDNILPGFSWLDDMKPICLTTDTCKRSVELPGSTSILFTSKSPIPNVRMRASWCSCSSRAGFIAGKTMGPFIGWTLPLANPGRMELLCSRTVATRSNLCLFLLELYSSSRGPPCM